MELFEKLNAFAKTAADKTNELVEDTRLKTQILNDEKSIRELERKIGAYYYKKFAAGESVDEAVSEYCTAISVHNANIEEKKRLLLKKPKKKHLLLKMLRQKKFPNRKKTRLNNQKFSKKGCPSNNEQPFYHLFSKFLDQEIFH